VVLTGEGEDLRVDVEATAELRRRALVERLGREPRPYAGPRLPVVRQITEYLNLVELDGERWLACSRCGQPLGSVRENYKIRCERVDRPVMASNALVGEPQRFIDDTVHFRQFCCPTCGGLIENEVSRAQDPVLHDVELSRG
jgi:acetone carboxylase gamma subunit